MSKSALLLFIKNPIPGKTKTRLAKDVGNEMALKMYHQLTDWTREQALGLTATDRFLYYSNEITAGDAWLAQDFHKRLQHPGGTTKWSSSGQTALASTPTTSTKPLLR